MGAATARGPITPQTIPRIIRRLLLALAHSNGDPMDLRLRASGSSCGRISSPLLTMVAFSATRDLVWEPGKRHFFHLRQFVF